MIKKVGKIVIGVLIGLIVIAIAWYLIDSFTQESTKSDQVATIQEDILTSSVIEEVKERRSVIDYPVTVSKNELGKENPFE